MATQDDDIVHLFHQHQPIVKDAIETCARRHSLHAEQDARDRIEAMLHRCSDEMTERARLARASQANSGD
jgi:phosphoglycerate-specific signal transduction histidine kinase